MGTGISRSGASATALALVSAGLAACGAGQAGAFSWLHPKPPPADWKAARVPSGAVLAYPGSWRPQRGDPGTATVAMLASDGRFLGYLNVTPRQGGETLSNWASFRIDHNHDEGDRAVRRLASATSLHFLTGRGSCVKDSYTTETGAHFIEIACLVAGARAKSVVVGAAPPDAWPQNEGVIERAIEGFET